MREYLLASLMLCSYAVAAGDRGIPAAFHGKWNWSPKDCKEEFSDGALVVDDRELAFYAGTCRLKAAKSTGANAFAGSFKCSSEGESETRQFALKLEKGQLIVDEPPGRIRCK